jgi:hypothetical protein
MMQNPGDPKKTSLWNEVFLFLGIDEKSVPAMV